MATNTPSEPAMYSRVPSEERPLDEYEYQRMEGSELEDQETEADEVVNMPLFGAFKTHSLVIGLLIGFFVQFSTLGANFLVIALWENDIMARSKTELILLSLVWSAFTSFMAILTLGFLRSVVTIVFQASIPPERRGAADAVLEEVILHLECRFVVGALIGVCAAWTVMDLFLGMNVQIICSLATLFVSLVWCKVMMQCFAKDEKSRIEAKEKKRDDPIMLV